MKEINQIRCGANCGKFIPETRNSGSLYCSVRCGYTFRNERNASKRKRLKELEPELHENYKIIKNLVRMGIQDISIETAKDLGIDLNFHMGEIDHDLESKTTRFRLFDFSFTIVGTRLKFKKLVDECT